MNSVPCEVSGSKEDTDPQRLYPPSVLLASISASAVAFDLNSSGIYQKDTITASFLTFGIDP